MALKVESDNATVLQGHFEIVISFRLHQQALSWILCVFLVPEIVGFYIGCLSWSPMEDETTQKEDGYVDFLAFVLGAFNQILNNVTELVAEDGSKNQSVTLKLDKLLLRCTSYCLQMSVQEIISKDDDVRKQKHFGYIDLALLIVLVGGQLETSLFNKSMCGDYWSFRVSFVTPRRPFEII